jgi:2-polyprenyl-6-methoxyphenol hydroxylase-like FAD-dependent oxidoreductase
MQREDRMMRSHPSDYRPVAVSPLHDDDNNSVVGSVNNDAAEMMVNRRDENDEKIRKAAAIRSLLLPPLESAGTVDLWKLRDMAITEYGLVDGEFRLIT